MANEEALRKQAVSLYLQGYSIVSISKELGRSRQWVYKWICRHTNNSKEWYVSQSTTPIHKRNKISSFTEEKIIIARQQLEESPYLESGAYAIWHKLKDEGIAPPSIATINRVLNKHNLIKRKVKYKKSGIDYPEAPINMQMMDLIGPRYIQGGQRYYLLTIISNDTRHAGVYPILSKSGIDITQSIVSFWKEYTIPSFLQMDNELSFKGSNRHPRGLGILLRTAMLFNVIPVFIPIGEPWRNGVIERFNQKVERTLLLQEHKSFDDLLTHSKEFTMVHNKSHHYSTLGHMTPLELDLKHAIPINPLHQDYEVFERPQLNSYNLNEIRFIRLVRSDLNINIFNTDISVKPELMHTYVEVYLLINDHRLQIRQDNKIIQEIEFIMPLI